MIACAGPTPVLERLARSGDREQAQSGGVQHIDRAGEPSQPAAEHERDQPSAGSHGQVTPVDERGRRQRAKQDVAHDAPTNCGDHAKGDDPDDVQMRDTDGGQRTVQRERERPRKVQDQQHRRIRHSKGLSHPHRDPSQTVIVGPASSTSVGAYEP